MDFASSSKLTNREALSLLRDPRKDSYGRHRDRFVDNKKVFFRDYEREMVG